MPEYNKEAVAERQKIRTKELTDKLEAGMKELYNSGKYKDYLKSMSNFYQYSTNNIMLIHQQMPNATKIASFKLWDEKFNRHVKKGESGLYIYAPIAVKEPETKLMEKLDPETGAPLLDENGKVIMEEMTALSNIPRFKLVPVFDISQTHGDPLPELVENISGDVAQYTAFIDTLKAVSPLPIEFEPMQENQDGYCDFGNKIGIRDNMSETQTVCAVVHEMTHARLHDRQNIVENAEPKTKRAREIEAESIAYVVCQHYGIETSPNSFGYLAEYGSRDMSELKTSLDIIRKESNSLITAIDDHFNIICKERGIDLTTKEQEDDNIMPDPAIGLSEMNLYGYTAAGMLPLATDRAIKLFNQDITVYLLYPDNTESMVYDSSEINNYDGIFGVERDEWLNSKEYKALDNSTKILTHEGKLESDFIHAKEDSFAIYQIRDGMESAQDYRFAELDYLEQRGWEVNRNHYVLVYKAPLTPEETLEGIYQKFNIDCPKDFPGHSLSVSDVIVLNKDGEITSHYVDSIGFAELPAFFGMEKQQIQTAPTTEQSKTDNNVTPPPETIPKEVPIYKYSGEHAVQNGEIDAFRASFKLNQECGEKIDAAILNNTKYGEMAGTQYVDTKNAVKSVIEEYGIDRAAWVLAANINHHDWDGRLSKDNKAWAKEFDTPKPDYHIKTHLTILDSFSNRFREIVKEKPSLLDTLNKNEQKSKTQFSQTPDIGKEKPKIKKDGGML